METIIEAKEHLRENIKKGADCPVCNQFVKMYKRKLNSVMARCLIKLHQMGPGYHHVKDVVKGISDTGTNDFSKLRYWNFIHEHPNEDKKKKNSGMWCITFSGQQFAQYKSEVHEHVFVYNGERQGFSDSTTSIITSLGAKFDYQELMKGGEDEDGRQDKRT
jgi:hypothetical protein